LTIHIPLNAVSEKIKFHTLIRQLIQLNNSVIRILKIRKPKIAVLSLNPHCGENGLIGCEEKKIIIPVLDKLRHEGLKFSGPFSADGYFGKKHYFNFDVTVSFYHDQALIPFKILSEDKGSNFTLGLNIIRTSPSHGSALNIAGKNSADISSTLESIKLAYKLAVLNKKRI